MAPGGRKELEVFLDALNVKMEVVEHPAVFTVEAMMPYLSNIDGAATKNLFLKDKKKKLYLLTTLHSREINLNEVAKKVKAAGGLRLADESIMIEKLGVAQGCCTPLSLFNDEQGDVNFIVDSNLLHGEHKMIYSHPMENTATLGMTVDDFKMFLRKTRHEPVVIEF